MRAAALPAVKGGGQSGDRPLALWATGVAPNISPKRNRHIAARFDRLARNLLAAVCVAAIVGYWL